jgi:hypothetical protein
MKVVRALYATAAVLAVIGFALRVMPARAPSAPRSISATSVGPVSGPVSKGEVGGDTPSSVYDSIVSFNIFSRTRKAPTRPGDVQVAAGKARPSKPAGPTLTLLGTTIGPEGAVALIDTNSGVPGAALHHMGDLVAGARLVAITDSTVTLDRPSGPLVLHLQSTPHKKL